MTTQFVQVGLRAPSRCSVCVVLHCTLCNWLLHTAVVPMARVVAIGQSSHWASESQVGFNL